jgi:hypothetical protein
MHEMVQAQQEYSQLPKNSEHVRKITDLKEANKSIRELKSTMTQLDSDSSEYQDMAADQQRLQHRVRDLEREIEAYVTDNHISPLDMDTYTQLTSFWLTTIKGLSPELSDVDNAPARAGRGSSSAGRGSSSAGRGSSAAGRGSSAAGRGSSSAGRGSSAAAGRGSSSAGRGSSAAGRGSMPDPPRTDSAAFLDNEYQDDFGLQSHRPRALVPKKKPAPSFMESLQRGVTHVLHPSPSSFASMLQSSSSPPAARTHAGAAGVAVERVQDASPDRRRPTNDTHDDDSEPEMGEILADLHVKPMFLASYFKNASSSKTLDEIKADYILNMVKLCHIDFSNRTFHQYSTPRDLAAAGPYITRLFEHELMGSAISVAAKGPYLRNIYEKDYKTITDYLISRRGLRAIPP